jgi:hypothetical protein
MPAGPRVVTRKRKFFSNPEERGQNRTFANERQPRANALDSCSQIVDEKSSSYEGEQEMFSEQNAPCSRLHWNSSTKSEQRANLREIAACVLPLPVGEGWGEGRCALGYSHWWRTLRAAGPQPVC